ncbi:D-hexose-6-phosphate mutarotase [Alteromonas sp. H39]|uniref:D-hexose-6-phosphate mutarotase n=1 Tax=Alteromonas sp. H39 TaxID=3389876 RepID=UPI0039E06384
MTIASSVTVNESQGITFLDIDNPLASGRISLFGGHVLSYIPKHDGKERLWLSPHAFLNGERPIRGGIPVCWPWFSDDHGKEKGELPSHGFLRSQVWQLKSSEDTDDGTRVVLTPSFTRGDGFEYDCKVSLIVVFGKCLSVSLETRNTGIVPFTFNQALHSYFAVPDINKVSLEGVTGKYKDKLQNWAVLDTPSPYTFSGETDRIHVEPINTITLNSEKRPVTEVQSQGHDSVVIWNPWRGAATMSDMDAFGYTHMLCVETACTKGVTIEPGNSHTMTQTVIGLPH